MATPHKSRGFRLVSVDELTDEEKEKRREYYREYYKNNKDRVREYQSKWEKKARARGDKRFYIKNQRKRLERKWHLWMLKSHNPCVDCGERDPVVLDFDHIGSDKEGNLGQMAHALASWKAIRAELAKCEIVCANCHRRRTYRRAKAKRYLLEGDINDE